VAYHESGHALIQHYVMPDQRISRVSIIRRARGIMGYVLPVDTVEIYGQPLRRIVADIMVALAGHVCVKLFLGEYWTGAYSDYQQARNNFRHLAVLGYFGPPVAELGLDVKELRFSDDRVEKIWLRLEEQVEAILIQHADEVEAMVEALLEKHELSNAEVLQMLGKNSIQVAVEQGLELESVLEQMGVNPRGLAYQRREELPTGEAPASPKASNETERPEKTKRKTAKAQS
jgi:cell division protease FtsH